MIFKFSNYDGVCSLSTWQDLGSVSGKPLDAPLGFQDGLIELGELILNSSGIIPWAAFPD